MLYRLYRQFGIKIGNFFQKTPFVPLIVVVIIVVREDTLLKKDNYEEDIIYIITCLDSVGFQLL
jgi:hypothetical protein